MSLPSPLEYGQMAGLRLDGLAVTHNEIAKMTAFGSRLMVSSDVLLCFRVVLPTFTIASTST